MKPKQYMCHKIAERVDKAQTVHVSRDGCASCKSSNSTCVTRWLSELMKLKQFMCHKMAERVDEAQIVHVPKDGGGADELQTIQASQDG